MFVHHDLWDRDPPAPPNLITVQQDGNAVEAVAQITKQGYVFVFDRRTGEPLFDIEEVPVPASQLDGEQASPTQPVPVKPRPFARQAADITEADISPYAPNPEELKATLRQLDNRRYAPPSTEPVLLLPGYDGGAEWGHERWVLPGVRPAYRSPVVVHPPACRRFCHTGYLRNRGSAVYRHCLWRRKAGNTQREYYSCVCST